MEHIAHIPEYGVVVCKACEHAVLPSHMNAHFQAARPHRFTREARDQVMAATSRMEGLVADEAALQEVGIQFPPDTAQPIAELGEARRGGLRCTFRCREGRPCAYVSSKAKKMQEHCRQVHSWENKQRRGRPRRDGRDEQQEVPWRTGVTYQRFFKQGPKSGYFEVGRGMGEEQAREGDVAQAST